MSLEKTIEDKLNEVGHRGYKKGFKTGMIVGTVLAMIVISITVILNSLDLGLIN